MGAVPICEWRDLVDSESLEEYVADMLAHSRPAAAVRANSGDGPEYDALAVQVAYRQAVNNALPEGFRLEGQTFYGPPVGHQVEGVYETAGHHTLAEVYSDWIHRALGIYPSLTQDPSMAEPDRGLWKIARRHMITEATTHRLYALWQTVMGERDVETTVRAALSVYGSAHVEDLADSGRYDHDTLMEIARGGYATPDRVAATALRYRGAIASALPEGVTIVGNEFVGPHPLLPDLDLRALVRSVDLQAVITDATATDPAAARLLWTIDQAADHIGAATTGSARRTLSRWGVPAVEHRADPSSGRQRAYYDAATVTATHATRPGRGYRTAMTTKLSPAQS